VNLRVHHAPLVAGDLLGTMHHREDQEQRDGGEQHVAKARTESHGLIVAPAA